MHTYICIIYIYTHKYICTYTYIHYVYAYTCILLYFISRARCRGDGRRRASATPRRCARSVSGLWNGTARVRDHDEGITAKGVCRTCRRKNGFPTPPPPAAGTEPKWPDDTCTHARACARNRGSTARSSTPENFASARISNFPYSVVGVQRDNARDSEFPRTCGTNFPAPTELLSFSVRGFRCFRVTHLDLKKTFFVSRLSFYLIFPLRCSSRRIYSRA